MVYQQQILLPAYDRGFHLITHHIESALQNCQVMIGVAQLFIQHTSASLSINENADPSVRVDFESHFNQMVPENAPYYTHIYEGPDDMPAHIKASLLGSSISFPVRARRPFLGTWQGIYLCEHRDNASSRSVVLTVCGE